MKTLTQKQFFIWIAGWVLVLIVSGFHPQDQLTWFMEVAPIFIAIPILFWTRQKFPLPRYVMIWIFLHGVVLAVGGHYTYAEVPFGYWLKDVLGFQRNPYDRIGHLMQGFVPALVTREILIRQVDIRKAGWVFFLTVTVCMGISMTYEFIEWATALILNQDAEAFLGTQGDVWDTQWDMFLATIGAIVAQLIYRRKIRDGIWQD